VAEHPTSHQSQSGFAKYGGPKKGHRKGCPRCGAETNAGAIGVSLRKLGDKGTMHGSNTLATRTRSLCEPCCVVVYEAVVERLEAAIESTRP
jgi:hypothetical protein